MDVQHDLIELGGRVRKDISKENTGSTLRRTTVVGHRCFEAGYVFEPSWFNQTLVASR